MGPLGYLHSGSRSDGNLPERTRSALRDPRWTPAPIDAAYRRAGSYIYPKSLPIIMEHVSIDDVEPDAFGSEIDRRGLAGPLGASDVALNRYRLQPGERFSDGLHAHMDQEEIFVVIEGTATFETLDGDVTVDAGDAVRFAPGEFQSGKNDGDGEVVAFALGAPRDSEDVRIPQECPECGHENMRAIPGDDGFALRCPECEAELEA